MLIKTIGLTLSLILVSSAFADDFSPPKVEPNETFLQNKAYRDLLSGLDTDQIKPPLPVAGKCTDNFKDLKEAMKANGWNALIVGPDKTRADTIREVMFNFELDEIAVVTLVKSQGKISQVCLDYVMDNPFGDGPQFKSFILRQHMDSVAAQEQEEADAKKKHEEEQHEPTNKGDGNQS